MFGIGKKITDVTAASSEVKKLQKTAQKAFSDNYKQLHKFTSKEMPKVVQSHGDAMKGLAQLSENMKSIIKK
jgi:hypothetical protein